ncbi:glycosyltransferase family 32 protein [Pedobacter sp. R20-19]|uniref:glycosyltransferase family 32 protein n=1 Tax=Pedobacter sp. R20-19 TaxID=1270196 RepID=UPI00068D722D|nr:glycosyltransferase [Pedobacter sp. R20-19]
MTIPKIIHQTWKTSDVPEQLDTLRKTWINHHPDWSYKLWTDVDNRELVKEYYPDFLSLYDNYENNIQRADVIRYMILYKFGGIYVDLDFECFENLTATLAGKLCVFGKEPEEHCQMHQRELIVCNAFIASIPEHPFMELVLKELQENKKMYNDVDTQVMETTGPFMITRLYNNYKAQDVEILNADVIYPLSRQEVLKSTHQEHISPVIQKKLNDAIAVHYWFNTWVKRWGGKNQMFTNLENTN